MAITPLNVAEPDAGASVSVDVLLMAVLVSVPAPDSKPIVGEKPLKSRTPPPPIDTADVFPRRCALPNCRVPALIVVGPL